MTTRTGFSFRPMLLLAGATLLATSTGCANKYQDLKVFLQAHRNDVTAVNYRLQAPDVIRIESPTSNEIDGEIQRIRSDGKISLRLIGEVQVTGLTPEELSAKLEDLLERYYQSPKVTVRVASYESKNIYVFGQVGGPGPYPFTGRDTLLDIMANAQPTPLAWGSQVKLIRPSPNSDERHEITVDVDRILQSGDLKNNFLLQEGDIVYVPPTPLAWLGMRVQDALFPVSPALTAYRSPVEARDTTDRYEYGGYQNVHSSKRQLLWTR